jgi:hypothetical protein
MHFYLPDPIPHIIETFFRCTVISQDDAHSSLIVCLCNSSESLLPSSVPYLQFGIFPINIDRLDLKVNTYRHEQSILC